MDSDQVPGHWEQFKGKVRQTWGNFTHDELDGLQGTREQFVGKLQEKSSIKRKEAEKKLDKKLRDRLVARLRQEEERKCFGR